MKSPTQTIIIIGAGAAGLMAAKRLSKRYKVIILEAGDRIGGRIQTADMNGFTKPVEAGAEFIHGKLPLTFKLLKKAGIQYEELDGNIYRVSNGEWQQQYEMIEGWDQLLKKMNKEKHDMAFQEFLQENYSEEKHAAFRKHVQTYAEGFDAADISKVSMKALYEEWSNEDERIYRIPGGHSQLISYMADECRKRGCEIITNSIIKQIDWEKNDVTVYTDDNRKYMADKCIVTVPVSLLQKATGKATINFTPPLDEYVKAANNIGYGTVIKVVFEFNHTFWNHYTKDPGFILSDEIFPAWWTQLPETVPLLTGWKGGPGATILSNKPDEEVLQIAFDSLSGIFKIPAPVLKEKIVASKVFNWLSAEYAEGAYSYSFPSSNKARKLLNTPVDNTIFFAGEALYPGKSGGTVEAALISGKEAADKVKKG
jgi:monoamine oxidase